MILTKTQIFILLLLLFNESLFPYASGTCRSTGNFSRELKSAYDLEKCIERSKTIEERLKNKHSYLYLKIPALTDEYLEYNLEPYRRSEIDLAAYRRKEKILPIYIELNGQLLNPRKEDVSRYMVSSKIKEKIISENSSNTRKSCLFMAHGSEYLFPIASGQGQFTVILYLDYYEDIAKYKSAQLDSVGKLIEAGAFFDQFIHRGLQAQLNFEPDKIYQLEIVTNPLSALLVGSYDANFWGSGLNDKTTVPGFTITLKELPPNTKFAFDGKDDVGKTYEQVKKEFILYDKDAEKEK